MTSSIWKNYVDCLGWRSAPDLYCPPEGVVDFVGVPLRSYAPLLVQFTDLSTGNPVAWAWDVEGGNYSTQNPSHTYTEVGLYTVSLTAYNQVDASPLLPIGTKTKIDYIEVIAPPTVLSVTPETIVEGQSLDFIVTLSATTIAPITLSYSRTGGTAVPPGDFNQIPLFTNGVTINGGLTQLTVPTGVTTFNLYFGTVDDSEVEATETVIINVGGVSSTGNITDNEPTAAYCPVDSYQALNFDSTVTGITFESGAGVSITNLGQRKWYVDGPTIALFGASGSNYIRYIITDPSVKKFDTIRLWSYGSIIIYVTDEFNVVVSYSLGIHRSVNPEIDIFEPFWFRHTFKLLVHTPSGFHGNIKKIEVFFNPVNNFQGTCVDALELYCSNPTVAETIVDKVQYVDSTNGNLYSADYNSGTGAITNKVLIP